MLDDLGLAAAVEWLVSNFVSRYGIDTDAQIEVDQGEPSSWWRPPCSARSRKR